MPRYTRMQTLQKLYETGAVPLFYHSSGETSRNILAACAEGGAVGIEFTNRGDRAVEIFRDLELYAAEHYPQIILGAGSVTDPATAALFIQNGANFIVSPFIDRETALLCNGRKIPYMPGCGSASEIHQAELLGVEICKIFPGSQVGGPGFIKAVTGPCPWSKLMPTGGVAPTAESLESWMAAGAACVGLGSQLIPQDIAETGDYDAITAKMRFTVDFIREFRRNR